MRDEFASTVAIPLHRGAEWAEIVAANVQRLASVAHVVVSDPFEGDDCLARVREMCAAVPVEWLGRRDLGRGWVAHYNDLLQRAATPNFMWLAQDDEIAEDWIVEGERALDQSPDAVLAIGALEAVHAPGLLEVPRIEPRDGFSEPTSGRRLQLAGACLLSDPAALGLAFRGLFRVADAVRLPSIPDDGAWADIYWVCSMLARGRFVTMPQATYDKRWRSESTHQTWPAYGSTPDVGRWLRIQLAAARGDAAGNDLSDIIDGLFLEAHGVAAASAQAHAALVAEAARHAETAAAIEQRSNERAMVVRRLGVANAALHHELAGVYGSRSWRMARPFRRIAARIRRAAAPGDAPR